MEVCRWNRQVNRNLVFAIFNHRFSLWKDILKVNIETACHQWEQNNCSWHREGSGKSRYLLAAMQTQAWGFLLFFLYLIKTNLEKCAVWQIFFSKVTLKCCDISTTWKKFKSFFHLREKHSFSVIAHRVFRIQLHNKKQICSSGVMCRGWKKKDKTNMMCFILKDNNLKNICSASKNRMNWYAEWIDLQIKGQRWQTRTKVMQLISKQSVSSFFIVEQKLNYTEE